MSQIGTLTGGAGNNTVIGPNSQIESCLLLGDIDTANPLQGLKVNIDGKTTIDIQNAALLTAFAKFLNQWVGTVVGVMFTIATGRIKKTTTITLTNAGATTPIIYNYSIAGGDRGDGVPFLAETTQINALSNETFKNFSGLFIGVVNVSSFDVVFSDGTTQNMTPQEMDALYVLGNPAETDGRIATGVTTIDNRGGLFKEVKVNTNSGGAATIVKLSLPQEYFDNLKKK